MPQVASVTNGVILGVVVGMVVLLLGVSGGDDGIQLIGGGITLLSIGVLTLFVARL